jgi:hypothetical protein
MASKKTTRYTKKTYADSFKTKLGSSTFIYTTVELRQMMMEAVDAMEADGITHVKACSLYVPPVDAKGQPVTHVRGRELEEKLIAQPYRSAADEHGA